MSLIPVLGRQRQEEFCEFKASQPDLQSEFQGDQHYTKKPCLKKKKGNALIKIDFRREKANDGKHWESDQKAVLDARPS